MYTTRQQLLSPLYSLGGSTVVDGSLRSLITSSVLLIFRQVRG